MFSSSDQVPITRTITLGSTQTLSPAAFEDVYEVARTADEIVRGDHRRVSYYLSNCEATSDRFLRLVFTQAQIALQFPDDLLHDAVPLYRLLKQKVGPGREMYVLADTSYGRSYICYSPLLSFTPMDLVLKRGVVYQLLC
jgi:diphthamide biosynthesis protein 2